MRDYLQAVLHRIYGKLTALRSFIRRSVLRVFSTVVYECEARMGVGELLETSGDLSRLRGSSSPTVWTRRSRSALWTRTSC